MKHEGNDNHARQAQQRAQVGWQRARERVVAHVDQHQRRQWRRRRRLSCRRTGHGRGRSSSASRAALGVHGWQVARELTAGGGEGPAPRAKKPRSNKEASPGGYSPCATVSAGGMHGDG